MHFSASLGTINAHAHTIKYAAQAQIRSHQSYSNSFHNQGLYHNPKTMSTPSTSSSSFRTTERSTDLSRHVRGYLCTFDWSTTTCIFSLLPTTAVFISTSQRRPVFIFVFIPIPVGIFSGAPLSSDDDPPYMSLCPVTMMIVLHDIPCSRVALCVLCCVVV